MSVGLAGTLAEVSRGIADLVAAAAPWLAAVRPTAGQHAGALIWRTGVAVAAADTIPATGSVDMVLANRTLWSARVLVRDADAGVALLAIEAGEPAGASPWHEPEPARVGALALALSARADAAPMARLAAVHSVVRDGELMLDLAPGLLGEGGPVLDAAGALLGLSRVGPDGEAMVIPYETLRRVADPLPAAALPRRAWLGASLQPISVPNRLRAAAGQKSGRMVIGVEPGGPGELAGLKRGDILLTLDGQNLSGQGALRGFLRAERIGREVEARLVRGGRVQTCRIVVGSQPGD